MSAWVVIAAMAAASSQPIVTAESSAATVTIGDSVTVRIAVTHDAGATATIPASLDLGEAFVELQRSAESSDNGDGTVTDSFALELGAYDVGELEIPSIPITYVEEGDARALETAPIPLEVLGVVGETEQAAPRPVAPPVEVMRREWLWAYVLGAAIVVVGLAILAWFLLSGRERAPAVAAAAPVPSLSPYDEAMARLSELEGSGALEADALEPAYTALSEIVRGYLGRRFGFPALDLTTEEINQHLAAHADAQPVAGELATWFAACDFVKFAEYPASPDEARDALYRARQIVEKARVRPAPQEAARG